MTTHDSRAMLSFEVGVPTLIASNISPRLQLRFSTQCTPNFAYSNSALGLLPERHSLHYMPSFPSFTNARIWSTECFTTLLAPAAT